MLVLSRKKNESIVIGTGESRIELIVVEIRPDKVRIGVQAPKEMPVHRKEVHDAIQRNEPRKEKVLQTEKPISPAPQSTGLTTNPPLV